MQTFKFIYTLAVSTFLIILILCFGIFLIIFPLNIQQKQIRNLEDNIANLVEINNKQQNEIDSLRNQVEQDVFINQKVWEFFEE